MNHNLIKQLLADCEVVDLSHALEEGIPHYPTHSRYFRQLYQSYWHGDRALCYQLMLNEHSGTHVDAPAHFIREGHPAHIWMDEVPLEALMGRAATVNVEGTPHRSHYGLDALVNFERENGAIEEDDIVLFYTGWERKWGVKPGGEGYLKGWPGPNRKLVEALRDRKIRAVGCDTISIDKFDSEDTPAHYILLGEKILIMENLTNLKLLPPFCLFIAIPLNIKSGSGSPVRPVAFVPKTGNLSPDDALK